MPLSESDARRAFKEFREGLITLLEEEERASQKKSEDFHSSWPGDEAYSQGEAAAFRAVTRFLKGEHTGYNFLKV